MIVLWLIFWAVLGQPPVTGWWLVLMVLAAISTVVSGSRPKP